MIDLRAPFPYFGGKRRCAPIAWRAMGNVPNYVEPFFGSGAVLLGRPNEPKIETVNDLDCFVANVWRALIADADAVAHHADWPVNEADLHARHRWLIAPENYGPFRDRMRNDPEYFDAKRAGWWAWGLSMWIGSGWCQPPRENASSRSARGVVHEKRPELSSRNGGRGVHRLALGRKNGAGQGVHRVPEKLPNLTTHSLRGKRPNARNGGQGVHRQQLPALRGDRGVHRGQLPDLQGAGLGLLAPTRLPNLGSERGLLGANVPPCREWFRALAQRLRRVRVCCGDWERVLSDSVIGTTKSRNSGMNPCGIFLDPPYPEEGRARDLYAEDDGAVAHRVAAWARAHGDDPDLRIVLAGYEGDYDMPASWRVVPWRATRGYAAEDNDNRDRERLWLSPHCLPLEDVQPSLFDQVKGI